MRLSIKRYKKIFISHRAGINPMLPKPNGNSALDIAEADVDFIHHIADRFMIYFGESNVFFSNYSIRSAQEWRSRLDQELNECDALVAIIDPNWEDSIHENLRSSYNELDIAARDFIVYEITTVVQRDKPVFGLLIKDAQIKDIKQLPNNLQRFLDFQLGNIKRYDFLSKIVEVLEQIDNSVQGDFVTDLDKKEPAPGLALSHYLNFVKVIGTQLDRPQVVQLINSDERFHVGRFITLVPSDIKSIGYHRRQIDQSRLTEAKITTADGATRFFRGQIDHENQAFHIIDSPRTLDAITDWLSRRVSKDSKEEMIERERAELGSRQLEVFAQMLHHWIQNDSQLHPDVKARIMIMDNFYEV